MVVAACADPGRTSAAVPGSAARSVPMNRPSMSRRRHCSDADSVRVDGLLAPLDEKDRAKKEAAEREG